MAGRLERKVALITGGAFVYEMREAIQDGWLVAHQKSSNDACASFVTSSSRYAAMSTHAGQNPSPVSLILVIPSRR